MDNANPANNTPPVEPQPAPSAPPMPEPQATTVQAAPAAQSKGWLTKFMEMMGFGGDSANQQAPVMDAPTSAPEASPVPEMPAPAPAPEPTAAPEAPAVPSDPNAPKPA